MSYHEQIQCHECKIEEREKSIRSAVLLFEKTKKILEVIEGKRVEDSDYGKLIHIDDWHLVNKLIHPLISMSSLVDQETHVSSLSDLYISID